VQPRSSRQRALARRRGNPSVDDEAVVPDTDAEEEMDEYGDADDEDVLEALGAFAS
jgi:hypothetical protein